MVSFLVILFVDRHDSEHKKMQRRQIKPDVHVLRISFSKRVKVSGDVYMCGAQFISFALRESV